ncbi:MAG: hypothetical protein D6712_09355, partial [Chloroflexi bacterium]
MKEFLHQFKMIFSSSPNKTIFLAALILLIAFFLRIHKLEDFNFNWDEAWSNWIVQLPYEQMIETTAKDVHPPLYYQLLRISQNLIGRGEFVNRYPSALLGLLTVALTFNLGTKIAGRKVGLLAAFMMTISRANIDIAQLSRMHVLATAFATLALSMTISIWNKTRVSNTANYIISISGALYSFYLAIMLPVATNMATAIVWFRKKYSNFSLK